MPKPERVYLQGPDGRDWGYLDYGPNGLILVSLVEDPPEIRLGAMLGTSWGKVSFDWVRPDGVHEPVAQVQGKPDERYRHDPTELAGEFAFSLTRPKSTMPPGSNDDSRMLEVLTIRSDGINARVPITAPNLGSGGGVLPPAFLKAPGGETEIHCQGDRPVLVCYDTRNGHPWPTVWSIDEHGFHKG